MQRSETNSSHMATLCLCVNGFHVDSGHDQALFILVVVVALFMIPLSTQFFLSFQFCIVCHYLWLELQVSIMLLRGTQQESSEVGQWKTEKGHEDAKRKPKCHFAQCLASAQNQSTMNHHILMQHMICLRWNFIELMSVLMCKKRTRAFKLFISWHSLKLYCSTIQRTKVVEAPCSSNSLPEIILILKQNAYFLNVWFQKVEKCYFGHVVRAEYLNAVSVDKIFSDADAARLALASFHFTPPPIPSQGDFPWLVAKKYLQAFAKIWMIIGEV